MKNIYPYTLDWAALLGLAILILLIYVFHTQQRSYRLFSFPGSEMKGGKKKKQRQNQKKQRGKKKSKSLQCRNPALMIKEVVEVPLFQVFPHFHTP